MATTSDFKVQICEFIHAQKNVYVYVSSESRRNHNIKIAHKSSDNVAKFKYYKMTLTNLNFMPEEMSSRLI
jgi:hypothetical protein